MNDNAAKRQGRGRPAGPNQRERRVLFLGELLEDLRLARGWTQAELAKRTGLNQAQISQLEAGGNPPFSSTLYLIAKAMGVPMETFLAEAEEAEQKSLA